MPGTRYSKASTLEFLNAKLDGIDDKIVEKRADYDTSYAAYAGELAEFLLTTYEERLDAAAHAIKEFHETRETGTPDEVRLAAKEVDRLVSAIDREMPRVKLDRNLWGYYPDTEVKRLDATAEAERAEIKRKIQLITDADGESFSITDLEKLGLLKYIR